MRNLVAILLLAAVLCGCSAENRELEQGMALRTKLLEGNGCEFDVNITADYGDRLYAFSMYCQGDRNGNLQFTVSAPQSIAGISGKIFNGKGNFTYEHTALAFPLMADNQITPVSAPWIFLQTLRGGYLTSAGKEDDLIRLSIDDSYEEDALHLDIWLDCDQVPVRAEILYRNHKILSLDVIKFQFL